MLLLLLLGVHRVGGSQSGPQGVPGRLRVRKNRFHGTVHCVHACSALVGKLPTPHRLRSTADVLIRASALRLFFLTVRKELKIILLHIRLNLKQERHEVVEITWNAKRR